MLTMKTLLLPSFLRSIFCIFLVAVGMTQFSSADSHSGKLTVGVVQRSIDIGMSSAAVVEVLGSPNIVSTDSERREVWVYDKVSRTSAAEVSKVGGSLILGMGVVGGSKSSRTTATSQKSLTIIIKFDDNDLVRDFSYRQSSF